MQGFDGMFDVRSPFLALEHNDLISRRQNQQLSRRDRESQNNASRLNLAPFADPFGFMSSMMPNMNNMMANMFRQMEESRGDPNSFCYAQSSVMSYSNDGSGKPKVYQATTSTRQAPGGIRETRKAVRDSEREIEKMAIGRHLNERGHVITRQRSTRTGDIDENQDYINLDEAEASQFNDEWMQKTSQYAPRRDQSLGYQQHSSRQRQALDSRPHGSGSSPASTGPRKTGRQTHSDYDLRSY